MTKKELITKLARMESIQDHLQAEIAYMDGLLKQIGFEEGWVTAKAVAEEILAQANRK